MNILYVEDDLNDAKLVELYVRSANYDYQQVSTLEAARTALSDQPEFDVIMVDVMLNDTRDGYRLVEELRASGYTKPIIAVTGLATQQDRETCTRVGFDEILTKPFRINELAQIIERVL